MLDPAAKLGVFLEQVLYILTSLAEAFTGIREPRTAFFYHIVIYSEIEEIALFRNSLAVHNVEFGLSERRGDLVFNYLDARPVANIFVTLLDRADAADVETNAGVEFQSLAAR